MGHAGTALKGRRFPFLLYKSTAAACEREKRKGNALQLKKRIHVQYTIYLDKKQPEYGDPAKRSGRADKKKLLPSSLRDATSLTEGGSGEKEKCSILPKAPSLRELARRKP